MTAAHRHYFTNKIKDRPTNFNLHKPNQGFPVMNNMQKGGTVYYFSFKISQQIIQISEGNFYKLDIIMSCSSFYTFSPF